jgi:hypothetical protein
MLKSRARLMGISFSNNIKLETLRERVNAKIASDNGEEPDVEFSEEQGEQEVDDTNDTNVNDTAEQPNGLDAAAQVAERKDFTPPEGYKPQLDHDHNGTNGGSLPKEQRQSAQAAKPLTPIQLKARRRQQLIKEEMKLVRCRVQNLDPKKANLPGEIFTVANRTLGTVRKFVPYGEVTEDGYHIPYIIYRQLEARRFLNIRTVKDRKTGGNRVETSWAKEFAIEVLEPLTQEELNKLATAQIAAGSVD